MPGTFDGIRLDASGRIWAAADGLHCFDPDGTLIGKLQVPEVVANFTFGGAKRNHLFICASSSLYSILVNFKGRPLPAVTRTLTASKPCPAAGHRP
jgi:gluconolactonase